MRTISFFRSLAMLMVVGVVVPIVLAAASQWRFGGASPARGMPGPDRWAADGVRTLFAEPLTDRMLADVAIRIALLVAWMAVLVFVITVVAEAAHMIRHGGHHLPDVRGLGWSQRGARAIAGGLLALLPMLTQASPVGAGAHDGAGPVLLTRPVPVVRIGPIELDPVSSDMARAPATPVAAPPAGAYVVRAGDSVFAIARHLAGPDEHAVATYAEQILDLNLGREMGGGERFTNPGMIDVGWVLQLPASDGAASSVTSTSTATRHVVLAGESLWSIADDELGEPRLWPELFDANSGRTFDDGRTFDNPRLVQPGWDLIVPFEGSADGAAASEPTVAVEHEQPAPVSARDMVDHDARHLNTVLGDEVDVVAASADQPSAARVDDDANTARPENVWHTGAAQETGSRGLLAGSHEESSSPALLTVRRAVMLATGVMALVAVRRRRGMREAPPHARLPEPAPRGESIEREIRNVAAGERVARVDLATRAATLPLVESGQRLLAALAGPDGSVTIVATGRAELPAMWRDGGDRWTLPVSVPLDVIATHARQVNAPCPALVQLGIDEDGNDVYVDLEAIEALEIGGSVSQRDAIVAAIAATLAGSVLAEVTTLVSVGVPPDAFLRHRLHIVAAHVDEAFDIAQRALGPIARMELPAFELRARGTGGETWDPAVVLVGSGAGTVRPPRGQPGLAVVSASPIEGPSSTLVPDRDAWVLRPLGLRIQPIGLVPDDLSAISDLVNVVPAVCDPNVASDGDCTIYATDDSHHAAGDDEDGTDHETTITAAPEWDLMVRLFGPVEVVDRDGRKVSFERSKTTELVAWLATHRDRSTRGNARTALWEQDVRDATFANVVSEARRALARLVPPPEGEEWVGRTLTEALPLHTNVTTDADVLAHALAESRGDETERAIELLRDPVEAIAGLPFEGTSYLWPDGEGITSNLILLATSAATALAARCLDVGDTEGVFRATARGLRVLPGHEELIGLRMRAHARAGDHAAVRQEWNSYERVVNADPWSDGEPSPKLVDLRKELLHPRV